MAVLAYSAHEQVDSVCGLDFLLICGTFCGKVFRVSVKDIDILLRHVNMVEEIPCHERMVALRMLLRKSHIFVHIECYYIAE